MSGARLEIAGQIRQVYPFMVAKGLVVQPDLIATGPREAKLRTDTRIPFDTGPDKSARVFLTITNLSILITADAFAPTAPFVGGTFYYHTGDGNRIYVGSFSQQITAQTAFNPPINPVSPQGSFSAERLDNLGAFGFEDFSTALGSATLLTFRIYADIGLYGEYSEPEHVDSEKCEFCNAVIVNKENRWQSPV